MDPRMFEALENAKQHVYHLVIASGRKHILSEAARRDLGRQALQKQSEVVQLLENIIQMAERTGNYGLAHRYRQELAEANKDLMQLTREQSNARSHPSYRSSRKRSTRKRSTRRTRRS